MCPCGQYFAVMIQMNTYPLTLQRTNWNLAVRTRIGLRCPFCNPIETVNNMLTEPSVSTTAGLLDIRLV